MPVTEIKSQDDYEKLLKKYKVVIINAYASWAGPCKAMSPIYERLSNQSLTTRNTSPSPNSASTKYPILLKSLMFQVSRFIWLTRMERGRIIS
ncbi:hypothetical protein FocTR4_00016488 [Fusarium oxysporum f. sp. cubense]|uniref:Thioredoxin domain-containing protein n=1 Tax=Fusarium oxysporum f. sp. cubense TaxID=61366 RepID=A0A5C6SBL9_FUSOC|nr:hypothetical protein FocTR4_00016488 [Fusarium oxysporum f. sp. cubense]